METADVAAGRHKQPRVHTDLQASGITHNLATLTWDAPVGVTANGYQVLIRYKDREPVGQFAVHVENTGSTDTSQRVAHLEPDARHPFRVKAHTADGLTKHSRFVNVTILAALQQQQQAVNSPPK